MRRPAALLAWSAAALFGLLGACVERQPSTPSSKDATTNATCEGCHVATAREHRASFHRVAFTDATFQRSLALEEPKHQVACVRCHAPDGEADGVGCIACHGSPPRAARSRPAPHALRVEPSFGTEAACASCHEFGFEDGRADLVQRTIAEHAASDFAGVPCASCHMSKGSHVFAAGHDVATLKGAVELSATRTRDGVRIEIRTRTGHAFPTGDMFRRVKLVVLGEDDGGRVLASAERLFGRRWGGAPEGIRREVADTTIRGRHVEEIALDRAPEIARVRWSLSFQRVLAQRGEDDVTLVSSDVIGEGEAR